MKLLLDSHAYIWWLIDDGQLGSAARAAVMDAESLVYVSPASIWELVIKANLGRLDLRDADLSSEIAENGFYELPITARHAERAGNLPRIHNDPFDRMLVAQSIAEDLTCVTRDSVFSSYGVPVVW